MQRKKHILVMISIGIMLVIATSIWLGSASPASAQCGSQASSCKNCHEVQGEDPVNNDGTGWHQSHAFGDFCYICHAGNNQAQDKAEAHTGMVPPLSDVKASCLQCHPSDLEERAQVYATALGVEIGAGGTTSVNNDPPVSENQNSAESTSATIGLPATTELSIDDANLVDYAQRYDEIVMGKKPVNWGNIILIGLIGLLVVGGGGFVLYHEGWVTITPKPIEPIPDRYPKELVEMLPGLQKLTDKGRRGLQSILKNSQSADELFDAIARYTLKGD
jgi:hypothetical protein